MRQFHAKFAAWYQTRSHRPIHLSDVVAQFESAEVDVTCCSGSEGWRFESFLPSHILRDAFGWSRCWDRL